MPTVAIKALSSITDKKIRDLFEVLSSITQKDATFQIVGIRGSIDLNDDRLASLIKENAGIIKSAHTGGQGYSINFTNRSVAEGMNGGVAPHPYLSTITVSIDDWQSYQHQNSGIPQPNDADALKCNLEIGRFIKKNQLDPGVLSQQNVGLTEPHLALISQIEASSADQITRTNDFFVELTERFDARNVALNENITAKQAELEADFEKKMKQLDEEKTKLADERRKLDDRTNTHARRAIRGELLTTLQSRQASFSISKDTKSLRWPIHVVFIFLTLSTFVGAGWSLYVWGANPSDAFGAIAITSAFKSVVFTFGFLTTAGLYVSWMNKWFDKHADAQFQTKQFEIDINRASWAVEAALEWKGTQGEHMPDVLLSGITKHLFEAAPSSDADYSPLEALASSILGSASNLNLDVNGNKIAIDRKGIAKIKKGDQ